MDYEQLYMHRWLTNHDCLSTECLESHCGVPKDTIRHFLKERRGIPKKYFSKVSNVLGQYGYTPLDSE